MKIGPKYCEQLCFGSGRLRHKQGPPILSEHEKCMETLDEMAFRPRRWAALLTIMAFIFKAMLSHPTQWTDGRENEITVAGDRCRQKCIRAFYCLRKQPEPPHLEAAMLPKQLRGGTSEFWRSNMRVRRRQGKEIVSRTSVPLCLPKVISLEETEGALKN